MKVPIGTFMVQQNAAAFLFLTRKIDGVSLSFVWECPVMRRLMKASCGRHCGKRFIVR
jgi:hypothetical protein